MSVNIDVPYLSSTSWDRDMAERLRWLRENDPVHWSEKDGLWVVTKYEDVSYISKDQELFTSGNGVRPGNPARIGLIDEPEPRHSQLRRLLNKGFTPRMVGKLEQVFKQIVDEALDAVADTGECDFVNSVAVPLPLLIIAEMIGIRREDRDRFHQWSDAMISADGNEHDAEMMAAAGQAFVEYSTYCTEIIESRRREPKDDLVSILVNADDEGVIGRFEDTQSPIAISDEHADLIKNELLMLCVILMVAGNETTRNALSGGMQLLIENPGEREKLLQDPSLIPSACEEMLRMVSPVLSFGRLATRDTELKGRKIEKGQTVLIVYPSANRDADVFEDPDTFRVERNPQHLAFGIGNHFCLGANLARMEMRVAFEELLRRFPDMEYSDGGPQFGPSALVRSCVHLHVRYTPESPTERAAV
ncbi:MAG: cytochrome P450 [Myxococcales bacterium]|nr:MAG: cytochrome P450 [Myxococcales bacterium]